MYIYPISFLGFPEINLLAKKIEDCYFLDLLQPLGCEHRIKYHYTDNNGCLCQPLLTASSAVKHQ